MDYGQQNNETEADADNYRSQNCKRILTSECHACPTQIPMLSHLSIYVTPWLLCRSVELVILVMTMQKKYDVELFSLTNPEDLATYQRKLELLLLTTRLEPSGCEFPLMTAKLLLAALEEDFDKSKPTPPRFCTAEAHKLSKASHQLSWRL